jgi:hypothetical protein
MAYALKYQIPFLSRKNETFLINLLLKDYIGTITTLIGAPDPFLLNYESGDNAIINPIRASECTVNFYNDSAIPLTTFYSEDDEVWKIEFYRQTGNQLLWSGFIVQDDCREIFQDPPHIIQLKGTDNLGLLKGIPFNEAWFAEPLLDKTNILDKYSLFDFIKYSLLRTGLGLTLNIYSNIYENSMPDRADDTANDMFRQTLFYSGMFLNDDGTWANCYEILEKIFFPLNATLQQVGGAWQIIRWPELRMFNNAIPGSAYDANFDILEAVTLAPNAAVAHGSAMEFINADATRSILRSYKNVKFTFNYKQPKELIRNLNLQQEGNLIRTYPDTDGNTVNEYELLYWTPVFTGSAGHPDEIYLRVITEPIPGSTDEVEKERYLVIKGGNYGGPWLQSSVFYIDIYDRVNISFSFMTDASNTGAANLTFLFQTDIGISQYKINWNNGTTINGTWATNGGAVFSWSAQQDINDWTNFSVQSLGVPVEGYFSIMLNQADNGGGETRYKDFQVGYTPYINKTARIIGHYHKQEIDSKPKNKLEQVIEIDDSPKHAIQGALFTVTQTNNEYLTLTKAWHRSNITESRRLGEITTHEREQIQSVPRSIMEGTIDYLNPLLSIMNVLQIDTLPNLNFIFGVTEFNFMEGMFKATLWEIHSGEADATMDYKFDYIYQLT